MAVNNGTILARAWLDGTNDFQQRITRPTISNINQTINDLYQPFNRQLWNQFVNWLVVVPAMQLVEGKKFENPLREFKSEKIVYGNTIQKSAFEWLTAHSYVDDAQDVFKMHRPKGVSWWISQNRRDQYPLTVNDVELRTAFTSEYGLNNFVAKLMELPYNSDEYDEMNIMINLMAMWHVEWGFFMRKLSATPTDKETGEEFLTAVMADAKRFKFPSVTYNAQVLKNIPTFVDSEELILITTPEVTANLNVRTYAGLFNMDVAKAQARLVEVPHIPIPGAVALLTSRYFFDVHDTNIGMGSIYNPKTMGTNYFYNHWGIYAPNPYVPAVLYTTLEETTIPTITQSVTGFRITPESETAAMGDVVNIVAELQGSITDDTLRVEPDACTWALQLESSSNDDFSALKAATYVDEYGRLFIQKSGLQSGDVIKIKAAASYWNPTVDNNNTRYTAETSITIE